MPRIANWGVIILTIVTTSLIFLDTTVIPIALPTIQQYFNFMKIDVVWVLNTYLLTLASFLIIAGKLYDIYGVKKVYIFSLIVFLSGACMCAFAVHKVFLLLGRIVQGIGSALALPTTGPILISNFPKGERGRAIGISTGVSSLFLFLGPLIGGFFVQYLSWRAIFILYIPVAVVGILMGFKLLHSERKVKQHVHVLSAFPLVLAIICLVTAFMQGNSEGWFSKIIITLFACFALFTFLFLLASKKAKHPLVDLDVFHFKGFTPNACALFLVHFILTIAVLWAIFFQAQLNYTPIQTGLLIVLATLPVLVIAPLSGLIYDKLGAKIPIAAGFLLNLLSLSWFAVFFTCQESFSILIPGLIPFGLGVPLIMSPALAKALDQVPPEKLGSASSVVTMLRQVAGTLGVAIFTALYHSIHTSTQCTQTPFLVVCLFGAGLACIGFFLTLIWVRK